MRTFSRIAVLVAATASPACYVEHIDAIVRDPREVQVTPRIGDDAIARDRAGGPTVDAESLVVNRRLGPFDVHRPYYHAVGGDGFLPWQHARMPTLVRVSESLEIDVCRSYSRYGHCYNEVLASVPRDNVVSVDIERRPNRALGAIQAGAALLFSSPGVIALAVAPANTNVPVVTAMFVLASGPLCVGLWHLLEPSRHRTLTSDSMRAELDAGTL